MRLQERKHWLNDDYVKFIRLTEHYVEKNGEGIVAYITPHGFLDNPTFRGMRWHLMKTFDEIWTLNLHGNSKKKEVAPDGGKDECGFNIMQGVAITLFVKKGMGDIGDHGDDGDNVQSPKSSLSPKSPVAYKLWESLQNGRRCVMSGAAYWEEPMPAVSLAVLHPCVGRIH